MDIKGIMEVIPHRPPFLLIDEIIEMIPGERAVGIKRVTGEEDFFRGHFPGNPIMPGVLIIEALAQTGAVSVLSMEKYRGKTAYFAGIEGARFKRKVIPSDILTLTVEMTAFVGSMGIGKAVATVNGEKAAYAELRFAIG